MRCWLSALAVLAATLSVLPAQAERAPLKRLTLRQDLLGFEAVGRLDLGENGYCTGVLIAPEQVLTAAHCLFDRKTGKMRDLAGFRFRAGLRDGVAIAERAAKRAVAHPGYDPADVSAFDNARYDVALVELAGSIPAATAAPFSVRRLERGSREIGVVSFARGRDAALSWQEGCALVARHAGLLAFDCDVNFGSSGAPVFDRSGGRPNVVAIISSGTRENGKTLSVGMELPGPVAELRAALRTGAGVVAAAGAPTLTPRRIAPGTKATGGARFVRP